MVEGVPKKSSLVLEKGEDVKGGAGMPVNSWTMARKLAVSVVRTVVGARREALDRFFGLRTGTWWWVWFWIWTWSLLFVANDDEARGGVAVIVTVFSATGGKWTVGDDDEEPKKGWTDGGDGKMGLLIWVQLESDRRVLDHTGTVSRIEGRDDKGSK